MRVVIAESGVANTASVAAALARVGAEATISSRPKDVREAPAVVLPGVGAFAPAAQRLRENGLAPALREAALSGRPFLAICLGMQLLGTSSEEGDGVPGLGIVATRCRRLDGSARLPHLGWNRVTPDPGCRLVVAGDAAFANSYAFRDAPDGWNVARVVHGCAFVAAAERGRILACQFHPELSGAWGLALLRRWLGDESAAAPARERDAVLARRVVACLDVADGRVVKGVRFQGLRDAGDPAERAALYERQGADEIALLDVAAAPRGRATQVAAVARVRRACGIPLTAGGGVRSVEDARALLGAGADRVVVNTAAVRRPELLAEMAEQFGRQCVVLAVDARRRPDGFEVLVEGGRVAALPDAIAWVRRGVAMGAGEVLLTSWDRDGTRAGCDLELIGAVARAVPVPVVASGGVGTAADAAAALFAGADAVLAASVFHDGDMEVSHMKSELAARGIPVRP